MQELIETIPETPCLPVGLRSQVRYRGALQAARDPGRNLNLNKNLNSAAKWTVKINAVPYHQTKQVVEVNHVPNVMLQRSQGLHA